MILVCGGCAKPVIWGNPNVTDAQAQVDSYECERDARMSAPSFGRPGPVAQILAQRFQARCMASKGYAPLP
jgi:hypothetical protein